MTDTIVILTEVALSPREAGQIIDLHREASLQGDVLRYRVLVPSDTQRSMLVDVLDDLSLLDMRKLLADLSPSKRAQSAADESASAENRLKSSLEALRAAGAQAEGEVTPDNPLPALGEAADLHRAREVVVVTRPHAVEETFHTDWASVARQALGIPVLHIIAGTDYVA